MAILPIDGYLSDGGRTEGEMKVAFEDQRDVIAEVLGGSAETELTISSGSVTPTGASHRIDTEADAGSDLLDHINQTNHPDGRFLQIRAENASRNVTLVHGAGGDGQLLLANSTNFILTDTVTRVLLQRSGTTWLEVQRFIPGNQIGLNLIQTQVALNVATLDFTSGFSSTYDAFVIGITNLRPATNNSDLWVRISQSATFLAGATDYAAVRHGVDTAGTVTTGGSGAGDSKIILATGLSNTASLSWSGSLDIYNPAGTTFVKTFLWNAIYHNTGPTVVRLSGAGAFILNTTAIDGIRFLMSTGNINGIFSLYGVRKT